MKLLDNLIESKWKQKRILLQILRGVGLGFVCAFLIYPWWVILIIGPCFEILNGVIIQQVYKETEEFYGEYGQ